jgi:AdoMet-dependent rRNA methyltransferase SPB1
MTAPIDIGQELEDPTLRTGQEDMFDLGIAERKGKKDLKIDEEPESVDGEEEEADAGGYETEEDNGPLDSEDERERRVGALEDDLDGMYDAYRMMRSERDAKFKVKEARKKNTDREETWGGIKSKTEDSDGDQSEGESESEAGGWEEMQAAKAQDGASNTSDDSSDEEPSLQTSKKRKVPLDGDGQGESRPLKRAKTSGRLLTNLEDPASRSQAQLSRTTQLWFSQDVFAGLGNMEVDDEEDGSISTPPQPAEKQQKVRAYQEFLMSLC